VKGIQVQSLNEGPCPLQSGDNYDNAYMYTGRGPFKKILQKHKSTCEYIVWGKRFKEA
jgi:hypothetical protein